MKTTFVLLLFVFLLIAQYTNCYSNYNFTAYPCSSSSSAHSRCVRQRCKSSLIGKHHHYIIYTNVSVKLLLLCPTLLLHLSLCSSISLMMMTGWFPALPLSWCRTALMVLTRPSSKFHTHEHRRLWVIKPLMFGHIKHFVLFFTVISADATDFISTFRLFLLVFN